MMKNEYFFPKIGADTSDKKSEALNEQLPTFVCYCLVGESSFSDHVATKAYAQLIGNLPLTHGRV